MKNHDIIDFAITRTRKEAENYKILPNAMMQAQLYRKNYYMLYNVVCSQFGWEPKGFQPSLDMVLMEKQLPYNGRSALGIVPGTDLAIAFPFTPDLEQRTFGGEPVGPITMHTLRRPETDIKIYDYVIIYDSIANMPGYTGMESLTSEIIRNYALRLTDLMMAARANMFQLCKPLLVEATTDTKLSQTNLLYNWADFTPYILVERDGNVEDTVKTFPIDVQVLLQYYRNEINATLEEFYILRGLSSGTTKRERQTEAETLARIETDSAPINAYLTPRLKACKQAKERLGLDISVAPRTATEVFETGGDGNVPYTCNVNNQAV